MKQLVTPFYETLDHNHVLEEYPRPNLVRDSYFNLNGYWDYAITSSKKPPKEYDGKILVPFSPESYASGVERIVMPEDYLWYHRIIPDTALDYNKNKRAILHFGAVDQMAVVYINGVKASYHVGGYLPFEVDITEYILENQENHIVVMVRDVTDTSYHSRGKQKLNPSGMFYTPCSGIWQTVWLEHVPCSYISKLNITPNLDESSVYFQLEIKNASNNDAQVLDNNLDITEKKEKQVIENNYKDNVDRVNNNKDNDNRKNNYKDNDDRVNNNKNNDNRDRNDYESIHSIHVFIKDGDGILLHEMKFTELEFSIPMDNPMLWSPESPYLYQVEVVTGHDKVTSYFGMRKYSVGTDDKGVKRLFLNNKPYFHNGLLDQGYFPEGLYTAPTDEALIYDIQLAKDMGFNMLRKHAKIEPLRWYYHCDRMGMLVWQDMVNGGTEYDSNLVTILPNLLPKVAAKVKDSSYHLLSRKSEKGRCEFMEELRDTVKTLYHFTSIAMWVPFNEGWGQFDSHKAVEEIRTLDDTRTIDQTSGWFDQKGGDVKSHHIYFTPIRMKQEERAVVLSEFGGYVHQIKGHTFSNRIFGYRIYRTKKSFATAIKKLYLTKILREKSRYLSAAVYTQLSDVEEEINGLVTYDRRVVKIEPAILKEINKRLMFENKSK